MCPGTLGGRFWKACPTCTCRYLRRKVLELEVESTRRAARAALAKDDEGGVFSLASIRSAIQAAVQDACQHDEEEKRKKLRQLQLRWHPGVCAWGGRGAGLKGHPGV